MPPRLPRANALKLAAMSGHGDWNESRTQEDCKENCQNQEAGEEGGPEKSGGEERSPEATASHKNSKQQRRTDPLEFQAHQPSRARRLRRSGRRPVSPARAPT